MVYCFIFVKRDAIKYAGVSAWVSLSMCVTREKNGKFIHAKPKMDGDELSGESYDAPVQCQYAKNC